MGLDMYLTKKIYIGANYEHNKIVGTIKIKKDDKPVKINLKRVTDISEQVGYWRKANHIHKWFVSNVQNGEDNCQESYVPTEKLEELLGVCEAVIAIKKDKKVKKLELIDRVSDLLPTESGFFFGGTEYDEYYYQDIEYTISIIKPLLKELKETGGDVYYQSSW